jgi:hypothetical protein
MKPSGKPPLLAQMLDRPDTADLKRIIGSDRDTFNRDVIRTTMACLWSPADQTDEQRAQQYEAAAIAMVAFRPTDEIEAMIVGQALAMHSASMECSRRAMIREQPFEIAQGFRKAATSSSRTFIELLAALDRKRGKGGQQRVVVEHVHVHSGGQAIVGTIEPVAAGGRGGGNAHVQMQPREPPSRLAHDAPAGAVGCPLPGSHAERDGVPATSDEKWAVPTPRRKINRTENG